MAKIIDSKVTLELSHEQLRALLKLIGNSSKHIRMNDFGYLTLSEDAAVERFYDDLNDKD